MSNWILSIPMTPPSGNYLLRSHWAVRKRIMDEWCYILWAMVNMNHVPPMNVVTLEATIFYKDKRKRDADNAEFGLKKITQDSLVRIGIIRDDTPDYVTWKSVSLAHDKINPRTEIIISEVVE